MVNAEDGRLARHAQSISPPVVSRCLHPSIKPGSMATPKNIGLMETEIAEMAKSRIGFPRNLIGTFDGTPEPRQETYELLNNRAKMGRLMRRRENQNPLRRVYGTLGGFPIYHH